MPPGVIEEIMGYMWIGPTFLVLCFLLLWRWTVLKEQKRASMRRSNSRPQATQSGYCAWWTTNRSRAQSCPQTEYACLRCEGWQPYDRNGD